MNKLREAAQQALELIEELNNTNSYWWQEVADDTLDKLEPCIAALRAALSEDAMQRLTDVQQEMEPVAWGLDISFQNRIGTGLVTFKKHDDFGFVIPLYTAPPKREWVGLTDEEIENVFFDGCQFAKVDLKVFSRAIEAKLKAKNNG